MGIFMKDIFKDLVEISGVRGAIVLNPAGALITSRFSYSYGNETSAVEKFNWEPFLQELGEVAEADFVFDKGRIYLKKLQMGFLLVVMDDIASVSMVRLNCEILLPEVEAINSGSRIGRIFKKKLFS
jgi:predicted regulator of Ras-like GTPase activity (Roadblock/LC7/MglB family)